MSHVLFTIILSCSLIVSCTAAETTEHTATNCAPLPENEHINWGNEPIEKESQTRQRICLNGVWRFMPAEGAAKKEPVGQWGWIRVPGSWMDGGWPPVFNSVVATGTGPAWTGFLEPPKRKGKNTYQCWIERPITIPKEWRGKDILLDVSRISTEARVFINDTLCGTLTWPAGTCDLTKYIQYDTPMTLRLHIIAVPENEDVHVWMETADAQVTTKKAEVRARGLLGDVFLRSRPDKAFIDDVFVKTSVRDKTLTLETSLRNIPSKGTVQLLPLIYDWNGGFVTQFSLVEIPVKASKKQTIEASWQWDNPTLWELEKPHLYTMRLRAKGPGLGDEYAQRFGFREFRIDGKRFLLNEKEIRLRPMLGDTCLGNRADIARIISNFFAAGFNIMEIWPNDLTIRGTQDYQDQVLAVADEMGMPVIARIAAMNSYIGFQGEKWKSKDGKSTWMPFAFRDICRLRNHPSAVAWVTSANFFGHALDQEPQYVGMQNWIDEKTWNNRATAGTNGIAYIKELDDTRPVTTHHGAYVGDIHTCNNYLNMTPLQEREEWLSHWTEKGDIPYLPIEFGVPMNLSLHRGRATHSHADRSECLMSEFCAIYFGTNAYIMEPAEYRAAIRRENRGGQEYGFRKVYIYGMDPFESLVDLFQRNTWRSWRTMGTTGGMLPWAHQLKKNIPGTEKEIANPPEKPGHRGTYLPTRTVYKTQPTRRGTSLSKVNEETLAWIAGSHKAFVEKDHNYSGGDNIEKQIVVMNDSRQELPFAVAVTALYSGQVVATLTTSDIARIAENIFISFSFIAPKTEEKSSGKIVLHAGIGDKKHNDTFAYTIFPAAKQAAQCRIAYIGDDEATLQLLKNTGASLVPWNDKTTDNIDAIAITRFALSSGKEVPPSVFDYIKNGGTCVMFGQDPEWYVTNMGMRISRHVSRRFWPTPTVKDHPIVQGLTGEDLRDWRGSGSLIESHPKKVNHRRHKGSLYPAFGWHWGNRGSVSSVALEKPHFSSALPLLEGEFDLAYSPLMELRYNSGAWLFCTLDLEGRNADDPVALQLADRIVNYAAERKPFLKTRPSFYIGGKAGEELLDTIGAVYHSAPENIPDNATVIIGPDVDLPIEKLTDIMNRGGYLFFMERAKLLLPFGFLTQKTRSHGSISPPQWDATRGLSGSDLRLRVNIPLALREKLTIRGGHPFYIVYPFMVFSAIFNPQYRKLYIFYKILYSHLGTD